jgi:hypothetical protein
MLIDMDATTRWETEAMRASSAQRKNPPRPSAKRSEETGSNVPTVDPNRRWVTLKEAETATSIPSNTIRKWIRKDTVDSYLESDGQMALRMVDLDSLLTRAKALGRETSDLRPQTTDSEGEKTTGHGPESEAGMMTDPQPQGTMLVPIDAWNKMLNQLGNLHEAGQQLAEARERAAKAETEATFLRERLSEMRQASTPLSNGTGEQSAPPSSVPLSRGTGESASQGDREDASDNTSQDDQHPPGSQARPSSLPGRTEEAPSVPLSGGTGESASQGDEVGADSDTEASVETTTYWRYLTTGWRDRKRRSRR